MALTYYLMSESTLKTLYFTSDFMCQGFSLTLVKIYRYYRKFIRSNVPWRAQKEEKY